MRLVFCSLCVIILFGFKAGGQNNTHTTNERTASYLLKINNYLSLEDYSTTSLLFSPYWNIASAEIKHNYREESRAVLPQIGDGLNEGEFRAETKMKLGTNTAVSGGASYQRGKIKNVIWNTTSDYLLLYPHVMADSVGGHLDKEQYSFYGKIAKSRNNFVYGIDCSYRALHEYRQVDPRPSNIVSDFSFGGSAGFLRNSHIFSITGRYRKYHQSQDIEFANPKGANTTEFFFTGLGGHFRRFAGATSFSNTRYRGHGVTLSLLILPVNSQGFSMGIKYDLLNTIRHLRKQNEAPVTELLTQKLSASLSYTKELGKLSFAAQARGEYELRQGTENIIDNVSTGSFRNLLGMTMYRNHIMIAEANGCLQYKSGYGIFSVTPSIGLNYSSAYHLFPSRKMGYLLSNAGMEASFLRYDNNWLTEINIGASRLFSLEKTIELPAEHTLPKIYAFYQNLYNNFTDKRSLLKLSGRLQRGIKNDMAVYVKSETSLLLYDKKGRSFAHILSLGLVF